MRIERKRKPRTRTLPEKLTPTQKRFLTALKKDDSYPKFLEKWNINGYVVDFVFRRLRVAVYVREPRDVSEQRIQALEDAGYTVLVYPPQNVKNKTTECLNDLQRVLAERGERRRDGRRTNRTTDEREARYKSYPTWITG